MKKDNTKTTFYGIGSAAAAVVFGIATGSGFFIAIGFLAAAVHFFANK